MKELSELVAGLSRREILRYMRMPAEAAEEGILRLIDECADELVKRAKIRTVCRVMPLKVTEDVVETPAFSARSKALAKNLAGCDEVILMAATLGPDVDRLLRKYTLTSIAKAHCADAVATALIEAVCDDLNEDLRAEFASKGKKLHPRFSPGYGDLPLEFQKELLGVLDAKKKIGLALTYSLMMVPTKSVSALIGAEQDAFI